MILQAVVYDYAMKFCGLPYRWGGNDAIDGFDCSGLCIELLQAAGVYPRGLDSSAAGLFAFFQSGIVPQPTFGTLAFFGSNTGSGISHVGFCLNETHMLEAGGGTSKTTSKEAAAQQNAYIRIRPLKSRTDLVGLRHPSYPWKG
jgi:cell wall-associated NlpC family hydrolase